MKVTALASCLKQLCHLDLSSCELGDMACVGAVGQVAHSPALTRLHPRLHLYSNIGPGKGLTREGLMMLTRLSCLECLYLDTNAAVTGEVVDAFWAQLRNRVCGGHCTSVHHLLQAAIL
jgi:hypothetical protein